MDKIYLHGVLHDMLWIRPTHLEEQGLTPNQETMTYQSLTTIDFL